MWKICLFTYLFVKKYLLYQFIKFVLDICFKKLRKYRHKEKREKEEEKHGGRRRKEEEEIIYYATN